MEGNGIKLYLDPEHGGYEDYIHTSLSDSSTTAKYQDIIHAEVMKVNQLQDRSQKKADFHVLRESAMPALLTENGFIDNAQDAALNEAIFLAAKGGTRSCQWDCTSF